MLAISGLTIFLPVLIILGPILSVPVEAHGYYNCSDCHRFPSKDLDISLSNVKRILIDETNNKVIVAARDCLVRLQPSLSSDKSSYDYVKLAPSNELVKQCVSSGKSEDACHNYMRLLIFDNTQKIFACGTYATKPRCWRFETTGPLLPWPVNGISGDTRSPSYPDQNVTGLISNHPVNNGYLFTGINLGSGTRSSTIYRQSVNVSSDSSFLRTEDSEIFLKDANFVSSYLGPDNFIYFFWREKAIESQNLDVYSRIGRVCSYDTGVPFVLKNKFTSFTKSRLSCTVPGSPEFSYNHIQSTFEYTTPAGDVYFYGIFTTPESGLAGSAVCVYSSSAIQSLFSNSKYLEEVKLDNSQDVTTKAWKTVMPPSHVADPGRPNCSASLDTKLYMLETSKFAKKHPLLADTVQPSEGKPLFVMPDVRFTQIVVDKVQVLVGSKVQSITVMFLATDNGTIYKVIPGVLPSRKATIFEQMNIFQTSQPIYTMKLFKSALYIGSTSGVTKIPTHRCDQYKSCKSCIELKDPYCGWSNKRCMIKEEAGNSAWVQDITQGQYTSVCPEEPPSCSIRIAVNNPGGTTALECTASGIPVPMITQWQKDGSEIPKGGDYNVQKLDSLHQQRLLISTFGLEHLGDYCCIVQNNKGSSHTCSISVKGTLPVVSSGLTKRNDITYFWCKAKGIPEPRIAIYKVVGGVIKPINTNEISINKDNGDRAYYCMAQNTFGSAMGENHTIDERFINVELKLIAVWTPELKIPESAGYKNLSNQVKKAIQSVYSHTAVFLDTSEVTFSQGSVVADVKLRFAANPSDKDTELLQDLQKAICSGQIGLLRVEKTDILLKYNKVPVPEIYQSGGYGIDRGLFAVAILVAIVLSILLGFVMGIKFHRQALDSCGSKQHDTSIHEEKNIESLKYMKSPTIEDTRKHQNHHQKLLHKADGMDAKDDCDLSDEDQISTGSSGGRIHIIIESSKTPQKKILVNGKLPKSC